MSRPMLNSTVSQGSSFALAIALLVSSSSAIAESLPLQIAQRDVIVNTDGNSPNPYPDSGSSYPDSGNSVPAANGNTRFACQYVNGDYTVMYYPESRPGEAYPWATPRSMGGGWTAFRRCTSIAERLESYRPEGLLEMRTDVKNGYNIICVTTERTSDCPSRIVLTVPTGQDPIATRDRIFENLSVADSGQSTVGVNTYTGRGGSNVLNDLLGGGKTTNRTRARRSTIDLRAFLDPQDGGTGSGLRNGVKVKGKKTTAQPANNPSNRRLNPGNFR
ncbi:COP23 domain-containing protein [Merismopedia glauca]|uniref:Circadian oscillating protein COP23 n=1 Tax=Merismopedia glauca CCAP 1448/3 TaxID=1296344 RepID=A0A2T1C4D4_9CYAN|nr:COP23 domain-containing protein [Merismopedia glauca]PSB03084.1 hypothetical protein C7B64_10125 [Merismopedia glauca CCAP 1448/3]